MKDMEKMNTNIARVVLENKTNYILRSSEKEMLASVRGRFHVEEEFPKVGDFVVFAETSNGVAIIEDVLPRKTVLSREVVERGKRSNVSKSQILVTNVDIAFIVMGLDKDFNLDRLERYLLLVNQGGISPVVILNKLDLVSEKKEFQSLVESVAINVPVYFVSAQFGQGMDVFSKYLKKDVTAVLIGSSGAGKSTITNYLLKEGRQLTGAVRVDDSRGKHTTTKRELFDLPHGGYLIDTPGIRSLSLGDVAPTDDSVFDDIESLIVMCRYPDCDHNKSLGCAIIQAIEDGKISKDHFKNYLKIEKEREFKASKISSKDYVERKQKIREVHKRYKRIQNRKYDDRGFK